MDLRFLFVASALLLGAAVTISLADRVSTCKVKWLFGISCADVTEKLVNQIKEWQISQSCQYEGERCSYEAKACPYMMHISHLREDCSCSSRPACSDRTTQLDDAWVPFYWTSWPGISLFFMLVSTAPYVIKATHTSPTTKITSDLEFLLEQSTVCKMSGEAVSEFSKDPADNSTNFCSLQNLMDGSDLVSAEGYKQFSNKWICPGFDTANCTLS